MDGQNPPRCEEFTTDDAAAPSGLKQPLPRETDMKTISVRVAEGAEQQPAGSAADRSS